MGEGCLPLRATFSFSPSVIASLSVVLPHCGSLPCLLPPPVSDLPSLNAYLFAIWVRVTEYGHSTRFIVLNVFVPSFLHFRLYGNSQDNIHFVWHRFNW